MIRTRFAPSPTGFVHIGNLKMALTDFLIAKKNDGTFVLRVEDTDRERYVEGAVEKLLQTLNWAGINPDEGVQFDLNKKIVQVGNKGPYIQSERLEIYQKYINELLEKDHAYYCFCSKERLAEVRKIQELNKQATGYDGQCRSIGLDEAKKRIKAGESAIVRMKMPKEGTTKFTDLIRGEVEFENKLIDDQVILKADDFPTYHLAVVVDDHLMEITHVIRGEEWLSSTPKHIELYKMFGWQPPQFAHLPLLLNPDRSKLSKRQGDVAVEDYIKKGYLPEALLNFVALLGWNPGTEQEIFSLSELVENFSFEKINKAGAIFNLEKLDWMNGEYIKKKNSKELLDLCLPYLAEAGIEVGEEEEKLEKIINLEKERLKKLSDLPNMVSFFFKIVDYPSTMLVWRKADEQTTKERLVYLIKFFESWKGEWIKKNLEKEALALIKKEKLDNGTTLWPMRVALSGLEQSPGPFEIADILGQKETVFRLKSALQKLK